MFKFEIKKKKKSELSFLVSQNHESADVFIITTNIFSILIMLFVFIYLRSDGIQLQLDALSRVPRMAPLSAIRKNNITILLVTVFLSGERAREAINIEEITITS